MEKQNRYDPCIFPQVSEVYDAAVSATSDSSLNILRKPKLETIPNYLLSKSVTTNSCGILTWKTGKQNASCSRSGYQTNYVPVLLVHDSHVASLMLRELVGSTTIFKWGNTFRTEQGKGGGKLPAAGWGLSSLLPLPCQQHIPCLPGSGGHNSPPPVPLPGGQGTRS